MSDKMQGGILAGSTSVSLPIILRKTSDNTEQTGKVASDMTASYWRQGGIRVAISLSDLAAVNSAYSSGGVKEVDSTNTPGLYRLDAPDAAFATGADWVVIAVKVAGTYVFFEKYALTTNVIQTGDSFARIGATGSGLTSLAPASTALSTAQWSNTRVGYLDNLSAGAVALASTALSTAQWSNTRAGYLDNLSGGAVALAATIGSPAHTTIAGDIAAVSTQVTNLASSIDATAIADTILHRSLSDSVSDQGEFSRRAVGQGFRKLINKTDATTTPGFETVFKENDSTPAYTQAIITDATAVPITSIG